MNHVISPTGVAVLLLLALVIDYMSVGPTGFRDRVAFLLGLVAIREGFNGSPLDAWTVDALSNLIDGLLNMAGGAYIAGAAVNVVLSGVIGVLAIYTVGVMLPTKAEKKMGRFAHLAFKREATQRLNTQLWVFAILLGMLADLPGGLVGNLLAGAITALTELVQPLPNLLFGA